MDILTGTERADFIQGLIDAATFLATNPDVPVSTYSTTHIWYFAGRADTAEGREKVDGAAALIGCGAAIDHGDYAAQRQFSPVPGAVVYRATAIGAASAKAAAEIGEAAA